MCGRFAFTDTEKFYERFDVKNKIDLKPRYNIAPGADVPVVLREEENRAMLMKWGFIPHWAKDAKIGYKMINARSETVREKPSFAKSLVTHRCLVPANGFYEWEKSGPEKIPYFITLKGEPLFGLACLYDVWRNEQGKDIFSFTILTAPANRLVARIHDRMPVIIKKPQESLWLDKEIKDGEKLVKLLEPYDAGAMQAFEVSKEVNKAAYDSKNLIKPVAGKKTMQANLPF